VKKGGAEGSSVLKSIKDKAKFVISGESYQGRKELTKSIRECLQKTAAGFNRF